MRYLVTSNCGSPFFTEWFNADSHFNKNIGMIVYDLRFNKYTTDGVTWMEIKIDSL